MRQFMPYFDGLRAAVHEIAQEQEIDVRRPADRVEPSEQVAVLTVQVADHVDGRPDLEQHGLLEERTPGVRAQGPDGSRVAQIDGARQQAVHEVVDPETGVDAALETRLFRHDVYAAVACKCVYDVYKRTFGVRARRNNMSESRDRDTVIIGTPHNIIIVTIFRL